MCSARKEIWVFHIIPHNSLSEHLISYVLKNLTSWSLQDRRALITKWSPSTFKALQKGKAKSSSPKHSLRKREGEGHALLQTTLQQSYEFSWLISGVLEGEHSPSRVSRSWRWGSQLHCLCREMGIALQWQRARGGCECSGRSWPTQRKMAGRENRGAAESSACSITQKFLFMGGAVAFPFAYWPGYLPSRKQVCLTQH